MILTATEVTVYSDISASVGTIVAKNMIPIMQDKLTLKLNNYFTTDIYLQDMMEFNATGRTVIANNSFENENFLAGDEVFIYGSYRNDGYFMVESVSGETLTFASGYSVVNELSGRSILISVVKWPLDVKSIVAQMIAYDYDVRPKRKGLSSRSLGPLSESYRNEVDEDGYPKDLTEGLDKYRLARLN